MTGYTVVIMQQGAYGWCQLPREMCQTAHVTHTAWRLAPLPGAATCTVTYAPGHTACPYY